MKYVRYLIKIWLEKLKTKQIAIIKICKFNKIKAQVIEY